MASVLAIFGPTASGKTEVAEAVAERIPAAIVSADAMQVYRGLPILTNQSPRPARLVAIWPLSHEGSVGEYQRLAHAAVDEAITSGRTPVVVGGTGLYLRAALSAMELPPAAEAEVRERWEAVYDANPAAAHARLPERERSRIHANDRRRVVRALELAASGASLVPNRDRLWSDETRHPTVVFGLDVPKEVLERRIDERNERMFERGVEEEVRAALAQPISETARHVHGLEEIAQRGRGAIPAMSRQMKRYAAYQRKWMRRIPGIVMIDGDRPAEEVADELLEVARARERLPRRSSGGAHG